jgi:hypothetical protein
LKINNPANVILHLPELDNEELWKVKEVNKYGI